MFLLFHTPRAGQGGVGVLNELFFWEAPSRGLTQGTRGFSRERRKFSVLAEFRHFFGRRLFARVTNKDLTETGNRARKVSGTQGIPRLAFTLEVGTCSRRLACTETLLYFSFRSFQKPRRARSRFIFFHSRSTDFEEKIEGL